MRKHFIPHWFSKLLVSETIQCVWGMTHWKSVIEWRRKGRWILTACCKIVRYVVWTPFCKILWIMFQTSGSPMWSIASPPSSQSQFCPHFPTVPQSDTISPPGIPAQPTEETLWGGFPKCFHTLCDLLCSCEVGLPNLSLNCCSSWVWNRDRLHVELASYCGVDQVPVDDLWCKVHWILYTQILALWTTQAE